MRKYTAFLLLGISLLFGACTPPYNRPIYILYDNDVHCSVEGYEKMAALRADYLKKSIYVNLVSCGDFAQGNTVGSVSKGRYPVAIMNAIPYDYVTLGNHEFDYGIPQLKKLMWWMNAKCLCCNLTYLPTGKDLFAAYDIRSYGNYNVAFIGVATPTTLSNSLPTNFQDENGNILYDFHAVDLPQVVQQAVNAVRAENVDRVILLSHLGDDTPGISSVDLIQQTTGIDVVLDGHAHHVINTKIANASGDSVIFASTGSNFRYVGRLLITEDERELQNELIDLSQYDGTNKRIHNKIESVMKRVLNKTSRYVGYTEVTLTDSDEHGNRLVRCGETNLGDFVADAFRVVSHSDIGVVTGGGLRSSLNTGQITYGELLQVLPFNNTLFRVELTGQQLVDNLEIAVSRYSQESGDFMHVSGMRYAFDSSVPSSVVWDEDGKFDSIGDTRRIVSADIWRDTAWIPVEMDSTYTIGGQNYSLLCGGTCGMFQEAQPLPIEHILDVEVLMKYIEQLGDTIRMAQYGSSQQRITINN